MHQKPKTTKPPSEVPPGWIMVDPVDYEYRVRGRVAGWVGRTGMNYPLWSWTAFPTFAGTAKRGTAKTRDEAIEKVTLHVLRTAMS
jgi:hypothetical protein